METAKALALAGYDIVFVDRPGKQGERVADILMDGDTWEMKSPRSDSLKAIEGNVKRASKRPNGTQFTFLGRFFAASLGLVKRPCTTQASGVLV